MDIEQHAENKSIHSVQSVPIFSSAAESSPKGEGTISRKISQKSRRVSFASSTQLTQYLEPISPFDSLGEPLDSVDEKSGSDCGKTIFL